jgi:drug/metabolite transporter (DMT)-like permease
MVGGIISFTSMAIAGREVSFELDTFEIMLYRSIIGILVVSIVAKSLGALNEIKTQILKQHFYRNIAHFSGQNLWFYAISVIPLAQVFALEFTMPIWIIIFSSLMLGEKITRIKVTAVLIGFLGILVVARPSIETLNLGIGTAALSAVGFALTSIFTRRLTETESITCILFYLTSMQLIFGLIATGYDGDIMLPSINTAPWLLLIGFAGLTAHFCVTKALSIAPPSVVMPIDFVRLPIIAFVGMIFYNEPLDLFVILGAVLICYANWLNLTKGERSN